MLRNLTGWPFHYEKIDNMAHILFQAVWLYESANGKVYNTVILSIITLTIIHWKGGRQ